MKRLTQIVGLAMACAFASGAAHADTLEKPGGFPERPLTIVVPYGTGGGSDTVARALAGPLSEVVDTEVRVINQPGAGGFAALPDYLSRPADGYAIFQHTNFVIEGEVVGRVDIDILGELHPLCTANKAYSQVYIRTDDERSSDWESFVAYAKENPGDIKVGNVNTELGQVNLLAEAAGFEVEQINFGMPAERYASVVGGHADVLYEQPGDVRSFLDAGQMKPILTLLKDERPADFPDTPILTDVGLGDLQTIFLTRMIMVHSDVPEARKEYLEAACRQAYESEQFQAQLVKQNLDPATSYLTAAETRELLEGQKAAFRMIHGK